MTMINSVNTVDGNLMANALSSNDTPTDPTAGSTDAAGSTAGSGSPTAAQTTASSSGLSALSNPTTFLNMLMTELENQDPTDPMSDSTLMTQTADLTQVEAIDNLNTNITAQSSATANQSATGMLGSYVAGTDAAGNAVTGEVTSVSLSSAGTPSLTVGTSTIPLSSVTQVSLMPPTS